MTAERREAPRGAFVCIFTHAQAPGVDDLVVVDARVDEGPMFKRIRPRARGMAFGIKRRMSHIKVSLDTIVSTADQVAGE